MALQRHNKIRTASLPARIWCVRIEPKWC